MSTADEHFIQGIYEVYPHQAIDGAGGSLPAFAVRDHRYGRQDLMAVQVQRNAPPRALPMTTLIGETAQNLLLPISFGTARLARGEAQFVIMPQPPGPAVLPDGHGQASQAWGERALIDLVLRPAALALDYLAQQGITHRAIRGNNVFQARPGEVVTLGGAWAAPPASLQPTVFEPPYSAMCHPNGRGDGLIADDVYALGVLLITLAIGTLPLAECEPGEIIRRKLERGSFAALVGSNRLPPSIADLARGMLAEDPAHRPPPVLLADPLAARSRRVAARPPQRAQTPIELDGIQAWDARTLAFAIYRAPTSGLRLLRGPEIDPWLRRALGDPLLAARIEDEVRSGNSTHTTDSGASDALLMLRCIALLDPLAPACWRGAALFPDGIGSLAAFAGEGNDKLRDAITSFILNEGAPVWAETQGERQTERIDIAVVRLDSRQNRLLLHIPGWAGGFARLRYGLNPLLACSSKLLGAAWVVRLSDLLPALERAAQTMPQNAANLVIDQDIAAFISARLKGRMDPEFAAIAQDEDPEIDPPGHRGLAQLRVLARLADHDPSATWPNLAAIALRRAEAATKRWHSQAARETCLAQLREAAAAGSLVAMLGILENRTSLQEDADTAKAAEAEIARLDHMLQRLAAARDQRVAQARMTAQELTAALGLIVLVVIAVAGAFGLRSYGS